MQHIDFGDDRDKEALLGFAGRVRHMRGTRSRVMTCPPTRPISHDRATSSTACQPIPPMALAQRPALTSPGSAGPPFSTGDAMRLLFETCVAAIAALSGEPPLIRGLIPPHLD